MPELIRILKDGYWDRTTVVRDEDGNLRVRKESKNTPGPWARKALRNEIAYLQSLPDDVRRFFPPLLHTWDAETIGYEIPYYHDRGDFSALVLRSDIDQATADDMQAQLADVVFEKIHRPVDEPDTRFPEHLIDVLTTSLEALAGEARLAPIVEAEFIVLNGVRIPGLRGALDHLFAKDAFAAFDAVSPVRLHGDLILENILWPPLLLIDPVSVAGLTSGHPLFDLVKYESFASGGLFAIREELVTADLEADACRFEIAWDHPQLAPFRRLDLTTTFRAAYRRRHGDVDPVLYTLLDAYFSLVMARNTTGTHQRARVLKAAECLSTASRAPSGHH